MQSSEQAQWTIKRIFIASPGDLSKERKDFPEILEKLNGLKAHAMGLHLEPLGWEDTLPGMGRPQGLINKDVEACDLFLMLLWKRWGTPPGGDFPYTSGTEEEYNLARRLYSKCGRPNIFLYFRDVPEPMLADPGEQLRKVLDFRKKVEEEKAVFFKRYANPKEWEEIVSQNIASWLDGHKPSGDLSIKLVLEDAQKRIAELEAGFEKLVAAVQDSQTKLRETAIHLGSQAVDAAQNGRLTAAEELFAGSIHTYPEPWVINAFGLFYRQIGSLQSAEEKFRQLDVVGKQLGANEYIAMAVGNLGVIYQTRGELGKAEEMHRKALTLAEELGNKMGMANAYGNLALILGIRGNLDEAEELLRKVLALDEELGRKEGMAIGYGNLGVIYRKRGELGKAEELQRKALSLDEQLGHKEGMANDYGNLATIHRIRGELDEAEELQRKALALDEELGSRKGMAQDYNNLALIYQDRGELDKAEDLLRKALALYEQLGSKDGMANAYDNLAVIYEAHGQRDKAEEFVRKATALRAEMGLKEDGRKI